MRRKTVVVIIGVMFLLLDSFFAFSIDESMTEASSPEVEVFRGGRQFAFMFSWDDGGDDLAFSFLEDDLGFKHTTFAVTSQIDVAQLWGLDMLFRGHDIQSHSREHLHHAQLNQSYREYLLRQSISDIERVFGFTPIVFAYPYGSQNDAAQEQALEFFRLARGIQYESASNRGTWPIENPGHAVHSFPSVDGVKGKNMNRLITTFEEMVARAGDDYAAYKCYGHSKWFTPAERSEFFEMLKQIAVRKDTWYTSWGEALAYQLERDSLRITSSRRSKHSISFRTELDDDFSFGVALTYRIEIPRHWTEFAIADGGRLSDKYVISRENGRVFILLDSIPVGQEIEVFAHSLSDTVCPRIENMRTIVTREGTAFLAEVIDDGSWISDVDIAIVGKGIQISFFRVENPVFWANSTFGRVAFDLPDGIYDFIVSATDSSGNRVSRTEKIKVTCPSRSQSINSSGLTSNGDILHLKASYGASIL
ncbi:MAG: polysaccharide deacetylase family protein [Candidatus Thorarchaeota archaeon]|nr:MAG: polysaccharide deacetylase family protein [Candidatus Thorarchaeota archaeon]